MLQSSLHLHLLKTLEFRTDVSVTSMPGVAGGRGQGTRASHFPITIFPWDPRPKRQPAKWNGLHPLPVQGWSSTWPHQGADSGLPSEPQSTFATRREGCLALLQPGPQVQTEVLSPMSSCSMFLFCSSFPLLFDDIYKRKQAAWKVWM